MTKKNLTDKLARFSNQIISQQTETPKVTPKIPKRYQTLAESLDADLISRDEGSYCLIQSSLQDNETYGTKPVLLNLDTVLMDVFSKEKDEMHFDPNQLLFFDIETTGVSGSGAVPFLIGCGSLFENEFVVRQYLLADYTDETAMLEDLLDELTADKVLVTYNGASFDLPFVKDRMIINRVTRNIPLAGHIDLLHSTRRIFKKRLKDCSLTNIEREIFGFHRQDDIPGYLVPSVFFEWLNSDSLELMPLVVEHNKYDIFSLYLLLYELIQVFQSEGETLSEIDDLHALSKLFYNKQENEKSKKIFKVIHQSEKISPEILLYQSLIYKKEKDYNKAKALWEKISELETKESFTANIELSKFYEHHQKDNHRSLKYAQKAEMYCPDSERQKTALHHRISRLFSKIEKISDK
ncbi:MAG: hypothetical protein DWP97_08445 [Calditrichaeota bacterium]|nr:MAG: hypothetical protein DWP97_08445 [Calditrichota bacterium]